MSDGETRWGSQQVRQTLVTAVMVGIFLLAMALAFALVSARSPRRASSMGAAAAAANLVCSQHKQTGASADNEDGAPS